MTPSPLTLQTAMCWDPTGSDGLLIGLSPLPWADPHSRSREHVGGNVHSFAIQKQPRLIVEYPDDGVALASLICTHWAFSGKKKNAANSVSHQRLLKRETTFPPMALTPALLQLKE